MLSPPPPFQLNETITVGTPKIPWSQITVWSQHIWSNHFLAVPQKFPPDLELPKLWKTLLLHPQKLSPHTLSPPFSAAVVPARPPQCPSPRAPPVSTRLRTTTPAKRAKATTGSRPRQSLGSGGTATKGSGESIELSLLLMSWWGFAACRYNQGNYP